MIDLFSVKLNNDYDFVQDDLPSANGSWLCSKSMDYTKGFSYSVIDGVATRIEQKQDLLIKNAIYPVIESVCKYLNDVFYTVNRLEFSFGKFKFDNGQISPVNDVIQGDLVCITGKRNKFFSYVIETAGDKITVDNQQFINTTEIATLLVSVIPQAVEAIISKMINYDVFLRDAPSDLKSETIGNYSYTKVEHLIGSTAYPFEIVAGLENFKKVRFL